MDKKERSGAESAESGLQTPPCVLYVQFGPWNPPKEDSMGIKLSMTKTNRE